ncbi:MAG TPA: hypothetical protein VN922_19475 [Bacteroidia bacterium]|nr:hypothetical protein [Bacteroidia bacterium]
MDNQEKQAILLKAIHKNGMQNQIDMLHEEIGELMQSINKIKRLSGFGTIKILPPAAVAGNSYAIAYFELCSEIADVKITLGQLELMVDPHAVALSEERKLIRLAERLNKEWN